MIQEKIEQAIGILQEKNIDAWMTFGRETATMRDPTLEFIGGMDFTWQTALIITAKGDNTLLLIVALAEDALQRGL